MTIISNSLPSLRACLVRIDPTIPTRGDRHSLVRDAAIVGWRIDGDEATPVVAAHVLPDEVVLLQCSVSKSWTFTDKPTPEGNWTFTSWALVNDEVMRRFLVARKASEPTPEPVGEGPLTEPSVGAVSDDHWGTGAKPHSGPRAATPVHPRERF